MSIFTTVLNQVLMMFSLIIIGFAIYRKKWINEVGSIQLSNLLLKVTTPLIIITSFHTEFSIERLKGIGIGFFLSILISILGFIIAAILFKKEQRIEQFAVGFSNAGFIGLPIVLGLFGSEAVLYLSSYIVTLNLLSWTYGVFLLTGKKDSITLKTALVNPASIGLFFGFLLFISPLKLPPFLFQGFKTLADTTTPLAMLIIGTYIAKADFKSIVTNKRLSAICVVRLILIPLVAVFCFKFLFPNSLLVKQVILVATSTPAASMTAMFAQKFDQDYEFAASAISLTALLSLITIPLIMTLPGLFW